MQLDNLPELTLLHQPIHQDSTDNIANDTAPTDISQVYEQIHALSDIGIFKSPDGNGLIATSYDALQHLRKAPQLEALRRDLRTGGTGEAGPQARLAQYTPFFVSNPLHKPLASAMHKPFAPKNSDTISDDFSQCVNNTLASLRSHDTSHTIDLVEDFARTITRTYWMHTLGAPSSMDASFDKWSAAIIPMLSFESTKEQVELANQASQEMWDYLKELAETAPQDSLLTRMTHCLKHLDALPESHQNGADVVAAISFDGIDSSASAISNMLYVVLKDDEIQKRLREEPEQIDNALREALRLEPPLPGLHRGTTAPISYAGIEIPEGINIFMAWGCGNRDPRAFDEPNIFKLERKNRTILSFGGGTRFCKGRTLAMVQCKLALSQLLAQTKWIDLTHTPNWSPPGSIRTVDKLESQIQF